MDFRKKTYSLLSLIVVAIISMGVLTVMLFLLSQIPPEHSKYVAAYQKGSGNFSQHRLDDPQATDYMRNAYAKIIERRDLAIDEDKQNEIAKLFHQLGIWQNMWWMGIRTQKNPCDMWMMQQLIYEVRPDVIIEAGTFRGGSALYFAQMLETMGLKDSKIITIDIVDNCQEASKHPIWQKRVEFLHGSSTDPGILRRIHKQVGGKKVMVVLDSDHSYAHVIQELRLYGPLVSHDSYLVVEDTNLDAVPVTPGYLGPMTAVLEFLASEAGKEFAPDVSREAMVLTFNPGGWLKRTTTEPRDPESELAISGKDPA